MILSVRTWAAWGGLCALAAPAVAQQFSLDTSLQASRTLGVAAPRAPQNAGTTCWSQSTNNTSLSPTAAIGCMGAGETKGNGFLRSYDPATQGWPVGENFEVTEVTIGFFNALAGGGAGSQPAELRIYRDDDGNADPAPLANLTLVGSESVSIPDTTLGFVTFTLTNPIFFDNNPGDRLVVELLNPDAAGAGHQLRLGGNFDGQSNPSYIRAANCGAAEPTNIINFGASFGYVLDVCVQEQTCFTQSTDNQTVNNGAGILCGGATEEAYLRSFDPAAQGWPAGVDVQIDSVTFSVRSAPMTNAEIRIYRDSDGNPDPAPFASLVLLGSEPVVVQATALAQLQTFTLSTPIAFNNNGDRLVVGLFLPALHSVAGGGNFLGQSNPSYVLSSCSGPDIVDIANFGFTFGYVLDACVRPLELTPPVVYCTSKVNSCGTLPGIASSGTPSATDTSGFLILMERGKSPNPGQNPKAGVLLYSVTGPAALPFQGGFLCVDKPIRTTNNPPTNPGAPGSCTADHSIDFNSYTQGLLNGQTNPNPAITFPGADVWVQWTSRDTIANGPVLTEGMAFVQGP